MELSSEPKLPRPDAELRGSKNLQGLIHPSVALASLGIRHQPGGQKIGLAGDQRIDPSPRGDKAGLHLAPINVYQAGHQVGMRSPEVEIVPDNEPFQLGGVEGELLRISSERREPASAEGERLAQSRDVVSFFRMDEHRLPPLLGLLEAAHQGVALRETEHDHLCVVCYTD